MLGKYFLLKNVFDTTPLGQGSPTSHSRMSRFEFQLLFTFQLPNNTYTGLRELAPSHPQTQNESPAPGFDLVQPSPYGHLESKEVIELSLTMFSLNFFTTF